MIPHISEKENLENAVNTNFISAIVTIHGQCHLLNRISDTISEILFFYQ